MEHEELQKTWLAFIKERELAVEAKTTTAQAARKRKNKATTETPTKDEQAGNPHTNSRLHIYASKDMIKRITEGYMADKDFTTLFHRVKNEKTDERKYRAYRISQNGLLYFEDANAIIRLCIPASERKEILKEVHDGAHEGAHAGWERTLASLRERFYWPSMRADTIEYVRTCDPCQKIKHD
jgi:hypothetical protein